MLDIETPEQLIAYLRDTDRIGADEVPGVRVLEGGVSNRTVLVTRENGNAWVLKQALEKLRVKADWFSDPARVHREADGIRALNELFEDKVPGAACVPAFVFEDERHHILAMEAVPEPHENWKTLLLSGRVDAALVEQFGRMLGVIHRGSYERRDTFATRFADRSFFENLRLEPYYAYTAEQAPKAAVFLHALIADIRANDLCLVHGDYSPKNILVREGRLVLLDHEVIHFGDPAFDLGFAMTHLLSKAHHLPERRDAFGEATRLFWSTYADTLRGLPWLAALETRAVRATLGCLLARVDGRSPLEYLTESQRDRQRRAALALMEAPPSRVDDLVRQWIDKLS